jgi:hypothetical protein
MRWVKDVCVWWGRRKKKGRGYKGDRGKKKKEIKKKKEMGSGVYVWWEKMGEEKKEEKNFERKKTKLVLFVCSLCLVESVEL